MRWPHGEDPSPRQVSQRVQCHRPIDAFRPPGTPWTSRNTSRRQCLPCGTAQRCSPRRAALPARCGFSLRPNTVDASGAGCPSALVLRALCPVRISVSSSLLTATMNQKSSLREVPQFVSWVLTANNVSGPLYITIGLAFLFYGVWQLDVDYGILNHFTILRSIINSLIQ